MSELYEVVGVISRITGIVADALDRSGALPRAEFRRLLLHCAGDVPSGSVPHQVYVGLAHGMELADMHGQQSAKPKGPGLTVVADNTGSHDR